jgi:hypothetical protein
MREVILHYKKPKTYRMKKRDLLLLSFLILALTTCRKKPEEKFIMVAGRLLEENSHLPLKGITVNLTETCGGPTSFGSGWAVLETVSTNENGEYLFCTKVSDCGAWKINLNDYPNFNRQYSTNWYTVKPNTKNEPQLNYLYRNATLEIKAKTNVPLNGEDNFSLSLPGIGCKCFELTTDRAKAGTYNQVKWFVTRNHITTSDSASVFCAADIVTTYTILY